MRKIPVAIALLALAACGKGKTEGGDQPAAGSGSAAGKPLTCPAGSVIQDGACAQVVTPEKIAAVVQQQSRLDELARLLDKVDAVAVPVDLMGAMRQLEPWKAAAAKSDKLKALDGIAASLDGAVKQLRVFKGGVEQASAGLGNLKGELDRVLKDTGTTRRIEEVRAQVSSQVRTTVEPLATQVTDAIQNAIAPLVARFDDAGNLVTAGCALMALGRAGDKSKATCEQATAAFAQGKQYLADLKGRPAALFGDVTTKLETELAGLLDDQAKQLLDTAQTAVNDALKLPPPPAGSAAGSADAAAGSAAPAAGSAAATQP
jgi:hypothetical protein